MSPTGNWPLHRPACRWTAIFLLNSLLHKSFLPKVAFFVEAPYNQPFVERFVTIFSNRGNKITEVMKYYGNEIISCD